MKQGAKVQLRLPADIHQWLVKWAATNDRSMNGQMIAMLREEMRKQNENGHATGTLGG